MHKTIGIQEKFDISNINIIELTFNIIKIPYIPDSTALCMK